MADLSEGIRTLDLILDDIFDAGELAVDEDYASSPDNIHRHLLQTNEYASRLFYKSELHQVSYGHYGGQPAAFIAFQSQFHYFGRNRISGAAIKLSLVDAAQPSSPAAAPRIAKIAPLWAKGKEATRCLSASTQQAISLGSAGLLPQLHLGQEQGMTSNQTRTAEVRGYIAPHHPRRHPDVMNRILWNVAENEANLNGLPPFFKGAMIVVAPSPMRQDGGQEAESSMRPFLMHMQVEVTQRFLGTGISFTRRGPKDAEPVRFAPTMRFDGNNETADDLGLLKLEDWIKTPQPEVIAD